MFHLYNFKVKYHLRYYIISSLTSCRDSNPLALSCYKNDCVALLAPEIILPTTTFPFLPLSSYIVMKLPAIMVVATANLLEKKALISLLAQNASVVVKMILLRVVTAVNSCSGTVFPALSTSRAAASSSWPKLTLISSKTTPSSV